MKQYIKYTDGKFIDHPMVEDNLKMTVGFENGIIPEDVTDSHLAAAGYIEVVENVIPPAQRASVVEGYILNEDGTASRKVELTELSQEERLDDWVRRPRNHFLLWSDWSQMEDAQLSPEKKEEWRVYRQELRDMPALYADIVDPNEVTPPLAPTGK